MLKKWKMVLYSTGQIKGADSGTPTRVIWNNQQIGVDDGLWGDEEGSKKHKEKRIRFFFVQYVSIGLLGFSFSLNFLFLAGASDLCSTRFCFFATLCRPLSRSH